MYLENASGATADRPELLRLLKDARKGDVLLVESIDRLSRLPVEDWQKLKAAIDSKGLHIVALDLPTSHQGGRTLPYHIRLAVLATYVTNYPLYSNYCQANC